MSLRTVALLGFGRFGRALSWILEESGVVVRAFDPGVSVPAAMRAGSIGELVSGAEAVILAVPVAALDAAVAALRPHLDATHLVLDVGSVKEGPEQILRSRLGREVPWVATHPLFGPASLARGERPLRVVVCPNELHSAEPARALYTQIGCEIIEQSAEEHDRVMARTHVLTFFIAKGLMAIGADADVPFAPPSFQALHRSLEAVRVDAGHLFWAIQHENPFAEEERRRFIAALEEIDDEVRHTPRTAPESGTKLDIPGLAEPSPDLKEARELIDEVDREIVGLLARRAQLALRAGAAKAQVQRAVRDPEREKALLASRGAWASEVGLEGEPVREIFEAVMRWSRGLQRR